MGKEIGNLSNAAARLAGRDIGKMLSKSSAEELDALLHREVEGASRCEVGHSLAGFYQGNFQVARRILSSLRSGFQDTRK